MASTNFRLPSAIVFVSAFCLTVVTPTFPQRTGKIESGAGGWKTWVLASPNQIRVSPPPSAAVTKSETAALRSLSARRDAAAREAVRFWNTGSPGYRWNRIAKDEFDNRASAQVTGSRNMALLNVAIYDATVATWYYKYKFNRPRPGSLGGNVKGLIPTPESPSYPSEYAATAAAAAAILAYLYPDRAGVFATKAEEAAKSRLMAGVEHQSDVDAGVELGRSVAQLVIERARSSNYDAVWDRKMPTEPDRWRGENPIGVTQGNWKPWILSSGNQFRPPVPTFTDADLKEVTEFKQTGRSRRLALYWAVTSPSDYWHEVADRMIFEYRLTDNAPRAARVYALLDTVQVDANIAVFDAKYAYWVRRPNQVDKGFTPVLNTPNHPSFPSGHAALATASAGLMAFLFPAERADFERVAQECADSRLYGGVHFRQDNEVGLKMGREIARLAVERAMKDGSE